MSSIKIKDTTREQRIQIIRESFGDEYWGGGCDNFGMGDAEEMYQAYIDGEKEIAQINAEYRARYVKGDMMDEAESRTPGCGMGGQF